jgi:cytochrome c peroxidase
MRAAVALALFALCLCARAQVALTPEERTRIVTHGPWPPAPRHDATNRVSGNPEAIALGERLFFDPRLSGTGSVLCASCHVPFRHFQDARIKAFGLAEAERNTPTLLNVALYRRYGWDGGRDSLWSQSLRPLLDAREMRSSAAHVAALIRSGYAPDYGRAFARAVPADDQQAFIDAGKALAAFQETLVSGRTPFDEFRDALARSDGTAAERYPRPAQRGAALFVGKAGCSACHSGPAFTNATHERGDGERGAFRVPGLRNVALTAPYMHDGRIATLGELMRVHGPAGLSAREQDDLVGFLRSLTDISQLQ